MTTNAIDQRSPLLTEVQAADFLGLTPRALQSWRWRGYGPAHIRLSARCIRYRQSDLDAWLQSRLRQSTSDFGARQQS